MRKPKRLKIISILLLFCAGCFRWPGIDNQRKPSYPNPWHTPINTNVYIITNIDGVNQP